MNFQSCCTIQNPENKKSPCSLSLTDDPAPHVSDTERERGGATDSGRPKRADDETLARWTAPSWSTSPRKPIPTLRTVAGTPEKASRRPRWCRHGGARHNSSYDTEEIKAEWASRSGTHHEHDGMLGEGRLEWPGHGEVIAAELQPVTGKNTLR